MSRAASNPWAATAGFANLDYLADPSAVLVNLVPDKDGVVKTILVENAQPVEYGEPLFVIE